MHEIHTAAPAPLTPPGSDLRSFSYMPLDVVRLRDSDLAATEDAEVFRCAVLSWCVAWHQIPAASLPDDDRMLARLLGFGRDVKGWKKVRAAGGLRGWVLCSDGRLYHPVVAEKANQALEGRDKQRKRTAAARNARQSGGGDQPPTPPNGDATKAARSGQSLDKSRSATSVTERTTAHVTASVTDDVTASKGEERESKSTAVAEAVPPSSPRASPVTEPGDPPRPRPFLLSLDDPTHRWIGFAGLDTLDAEGRKRPAAGGYMLDDAARMVCLESGLDPRLRRDWTPLLDWMRSGRDLHDHILPAIRRVASRAGYRTPTSLRFFDAAVREQGRAA